ncbi:MAG: helix-turn-helix transcriptional regulator [Ferruginibacter sp.]
MDTLQPQQVFFNHIRSKIPSHISLVEDVAELLNISNDSAYRRIRGEKPIGLDEIQILCNHYKVSLDQLLQINNDTAIFSGKMVDHTNFNLTHYLHEVLRNFQFFKSIPDCEIFNFNKDIPIFHYMQFKELSAFKYFFWKRTIMHYPDLVKKQFDGEELDNDVMETGLKVIKIYTQIPSTEIWNDDSINITIRQIEYYRQTSSFENKHIILKIYGQLEELINHMELEAEKGIKFLYGEAPAPNSATYNVFLNECLLGDNTVYMRGKDMQATYINHGGINFMSTQDKAFCDYTIYNIQNIIKKSTQISVAGEKERSIFFNGMREKIYEKKKGIL